MGAGSTSSIWGHPVPPTDRGTARSEAEALRHEVPDEV